MLILHRFQLLLEFFILINLLLIAAVDLGQILHHFLVILAHLPYFALEFLPFDVLLQGEGGAVSFDSLFFSLQVLQLQLPFDTLCLTHLQLLRLIFQIHLGATMYVLIRPIILLIHILYEYLIFFFIPGLLLCIVPGIL